MHITEVAVQGTQVVFIGFIAPDKQHLRNVVPRQTHRTPYSRTIEQQQQQP
jgi:hypothetical protein